MPRPAKPRGRGPREVRTDKERLRVRAAFQKGKARSARKLWIEVREFAPLWMRDLARVMQGIARDDRSLTLRFHLHADMTRRMAGGRCRLPSSKQKTAVACRRSASSRVQTRLPGA